MLLHIRGQSPLPAMRMSLRKRLTHTRRITSLSWRPQMHPKILDWALISSLTLACVDTQTYLFSLRQQAARFEYRTGLLLAYFRASEYFLYAPAKFFFANRALPSALNWSAWEEDIVVWERGEVRPACPRFTCFCFRYCRRPR